MQTKYIATYYRQRKRNVADYCSVFSSAILLGYANEVFQEMEATYYRQRWNWYLIPIKCNVHTTKCNLSLSRIGERQTGQHACILVSWSKHLTQTQCPHGIMAVSAWFMRHTGHALVAAEASPSTASSSRLPVGSSSTRSPLAPAAAVALAAVARRTGRSRRRRRLGHTHCSHQSKAFIQCEL